jgi:hypothetical protein
MTRTGRPRSDDPTGQNASPADHDRFLIRSRLMSDAESAAFGLG